MKQIDRRKLQKCNSYWPIQRQTNKDSCCCIISSSFSVSIPPNKPPKQPHLQQPIGAYMHLLHACMHACMRVCACMCVGVYVEVLRTEERLHFSCSCAFEDICLINNDISRHYT